MQGLAVCDSFKATCGADIDREAWVDETHDG